MGAVNQELYTNSFRLSRTVCSSEIWLNVNHKPCGHSCNPFSRRPDEFAIGEHAGLDPGGEGGAGSCGTCRR